jgi:hypothetical protein
VKKKFSVEQIVAVLKQAEVGVPREETFVAATPNQAWSLDFVADQLQDGRCFGALMIVDVYTRESVAMELPL